MILNHKDTKGTKRHKVLGVSSWFKIVEEIFRPYGTLFLVLSFSVAPMGLLCSVELMTCYFSPHTSSVKVLSSVGTIFGSSVVHALFELSPRGTTHYFLGKTLNHKEVTEKHYTEGFGT